MLTGENLADAQLGFAHDTGLPIVNFRLDSSGARIFADYTAANVGRRFAAVLDDVVITAPTIRGMIPGGSGYIEGNFTAESATQLAILLRAGALPASIKVLEQRTVGPDLGADSIQAGTIASIVSSIAVLAFMALSYRMFGLFANVALIVNIVLMFAVLSAIGATLTLPGIAGIVLTIGMSVDANVLIYERIREELRRARSVAQAVETGYKQAFSAIIDANVTTLIAAVILFAIGSGPIKGFAVTLSIGLVTSVFTAVTLTRLMVSEYLKRVRPKTLQVERIKYIPDETHLKVMKWRRPFLIGSVVAIVGAFALVPTVGLNYGIDFQGGSLVELRTPGPADIGQIRTIANGLGHGDVQVQGFGAENDVLLRVPAPPNATGDEQNAAAEAVAAGLEQAIPGTEVRRIEVVGPSVSAELLQSGILAVVLVGRRHPRLHLVALRMAVRHRRGRLAGARRGADDRHLLDPADRVQPVDHRRAADHHRLFAQRHGRRLRPRAREPAEIQGDGARRPDRPVDQRDAGAHHHDLGHHADRAARPLLPRARK